MGNSLNVKNGFTLIEVLLSLGLIAIVAAGTSTLLISQYRMNSSTERKVQAQDHLSLLKLALSNKAVCLKSIGNLEVTEVVDGTVNKGFWISGDEAKNIQVFGSESDPHPLKFDQPVVSLPGAKAKSFELVGINNVQDLGGGLKKAVGNLQIELELSNAVGSSIVKRNIPLTYQFKPVDGKNKIVECESTNSSDSGKSCEDLGMITQGDGTCRMSAAATCQSLGLNYNVDTKKCEGLGGGSSAKIVDCPSVITTESMLTAGASCFDGRVAEPETNGVGLSSYFDWGNKSRPISSDSEKSQILLQKNSSGGIDVVLSNRLVKFSITSDSSGRVKYRATGDGKETKLCTLDPATWRCSTVLNQTIPGEVMPGNKPKDINMPWNISVTRDGVNLSSGCYNADGVVGCGGSVQNSMNVNTGSVWHK